MGAADTGQWIMIGVLMVSSLLNVVYLLPVVGRGFFLKDADNTGPIKEAPWMCWAPPAVTAFGCLVLFFYGGAIVEFLSPIVGGV